MVLSRPSDHQRCENLFILAAELTDTEIFYMNVLKDRF